jgi:integrase
VGFPNRRNCLSLEDVRKVLDRFPAESMYKYAALVVLYAGAREKEVSELQVQDVNFSERVVVIRTRVGSRSIPMTDLLFQSLTHYKNIFGIPGGSNGKFFQGYSRNEFSKSPRRAGEDSGVPFSVTGAVLRHVCMYVDKCWIWVRQGL